MGEGDWGIQVTAKTHRDRMEGWSDGAQPVSPRFSGGQPCFHTLNSFLTSVSPPKNQVEADTTPGQRDACFMDLWSCPTATQLGGFPFTGLSGGEGGLQTEVFPRPQAGGSGELGDRGAALQR